MECKSVRIGRPTTCQVPQQDVTHVWRAVQATAVDESDGLLDTVFLIDRCTVYRVTKLCSSWSRSTCTAYW